MNTIKHTAFVLLALVVAFPCVSRGDGVAVTNKVVMVDELGNNNAPEVLASVAAQATNEVRVIIAAEKATAAQAAANEAAGVIGEVVSAIVANEVRVFRKGYMSSFAPLIVFTDDDTLEVCEFVIDKDSEKITIGYVSTVNWGAIKPQVRSADSLTSPTADWGVLADGDVSAVTLHNEERTQGGVTYSCWYSVQVPYPADNQHFYAIEMNPDAPSGDGLTLDVKNGFTGGYTGEIVDGSLKKTYKGGVLMSVEVTE